MAELMANPIPQPPEQTNADVQPAAVPPHVVDGAELTIEDLMVTEDLSEMKDKDLSEWLDARERLGFEKMALTKASGLLHIDEDVVRTLAQKYREDGNALKCRGNAITRSCAFTGSFVILEDGRRVLYPDCPGVYTLTIPTHHLPIRHPPIHYSGCCLFVGWTQAINTLGLCANPTEEQLQAEKPTIQRPTRGIQRKYAEKNSEVVKVVVFKGASGKSAVIRAMTYDLLFNNMKSIVEKTSGNTSHHCIHNIMNNNNTNRVRGGRGGGEGEVEREGWESEGE